MATSIGSTLDDPIVIPDEDGNQIEDDNLNEYARFLDTLMSLPPVEALDAFWLFHSWQLVDLDQVYQDEEQPGEVVAPNDDAQQEEEEPAEGTPEPEEVVAPDNEGRHEEVEPTEGTCTICMDAYRRDDLLALSLMCGHNFHMTCLQRWREESLACPLCRTDIEDAGIHPCALDTVASYQKPQGEALDEMVALMLVTEEEEERPVRRRRRMRRARPY